MEPSYYSIFDQTPTRSVKTKDTLPSASKVVLSTNSEASETSETQSQQPRRSASAPNPALVHPSRAFQVPKGISSDDLQTNATRSESTGSTVKRRASDVFEAHPVREAPSRPRISINLTTAQLGSTQPKVIRSVPATVPTIPTTVDHCVSDKQTTSRSASNAHGSSTNYISYDLICSQLRQNPYEYPAGEGLQSSVPSEPEILVKEEVI